jgi:hypothetical protein
MFLHAVAQGTAPARADSSGEINMEPFRQSMRPRNSYAGAENILRIGREERPAPNPPARDAELSRKGQAALDLVAQVADTISQTENRIETLLVRALEQIKTMEDRNKALEERAIAAEARAREAEKWLMRLHLEMEDKFTSWKGQQGRGPAAAA